MVRSAEGTGLEHRRRRPATTQRTRRPPRPGPHRRADLRSKQRLAPPAGRSRQRKPPENSTTPQSQRTAPGGSPSSRGDRHSPDRENARHAAPRHPHGQKLRSSGRPRIHLPSPLRARHPGQPGRGHAEHPAPARLDSPRRNRLALAAAQKLSSSGPAAGTSIRAVVLSIGLAGVAVIALATPCELRRVP